MALFSGQQVKLFGGETKEFGENDIRVFNPESHRWTKAADKNGQQLGRGDIIKHHKVGSRQYQIEEDDTFYKDIDTDEIHPAILVRDANEGGKIRLMLKKDVGSYYELVSKASPIEKGIMNTIKKALAQLSLFGNKIETPQLSLFEGQTKDFGQDDTRKLTTTKTGVKRWTKTKQEEAKKKQAEANKGKGKDILDQLSLFGVDDLQISMILKDPDIASQIDEEVPQYEEGLTLDERVKRYLDEKQKNREFKDAGERVAGSKKEMAALNKLSVSDLLDKADASSAYKLVTRDKVVPPLDAKKMKEEGKPANVVFMLHKLREAVNVRPENSDVARKEFVEKTAPMFAYLDEANNLNELHKKLHSLFQVDTSYGYKMVGGRMKHRREHNFTWKNPDFISEVDGEKHAPNLMDVFGQRFFYLAWESGEAAGKIWKEARYNHKYTKEETEQEYQKYVKRTQDNLNHYLERNLKEETLEWQLEHNGRYYRVTQLDGTGIKKLKKTDHKKYYELLKQLHKTIEKRLHEEYAVQSFEDYLSRNPEFATREEDWSFAKLEDKKNEIPEGSEEVAAEDKQPKEARKSKVPPIQPLKHITRTNGREVTDAEITTDEIMKEFGYQSVQLGNWVKDNEAKEHIKYFLASMKDLEDALGLDIKKIHEQGKLSIAFGARGGGKALAHYESMYRIINLTKRRGDGTVAHEWGHFFDHYLGGAELNKEKGRGLLTRQISPSKKRGRNGESYWNMGYMQSVYNVTDPKELGKREIHNAMHDVLTAIYQGEGRSEVERTVPARTKSSYFPNIRMEVSSIKDLRNSINSFVAAKGEDEKLGRSIMQKLIYSYTWVKSLPTETAAELKEKGIENFTNSCSKEELVNLFNKFDPVQEGIAYIQKGSWRGGEREAMSDLARELGLEKISYKTTALQSDYVSQAESLGDYWVSAPELFARAFESYVQDKLAAKDMHNNYLVRNNKTTDTDTGYSAEVLRKIYPQGEERRVINAYIETLVKKLIQHNGLAKEQPSTEQRVSETVELEKSIPSSAFGKQINMFGNKGIKHNEGETKKGSSGEDLVLRNHRWHYLDEEYGKDGEKKTAPVQEKIKDPNQTDMFPEEKPKPPLAQVQAALEKVQSIQDEEKIKEWHQLADHYIRHAEAQKPAFLADMDDVAREHGLEECSPKFGAFAVKNKKSIFNKFERNEVKGKPENNRKMTDILRTTMVIDSPKQFENILESLKTKGYQVWNDDLDNLYEKPDAGYKHIAIKLAKGENDPVVKELLLMRPNMLKAKFGLGHDLYDIEKNIMTAIPNITDEKIQKMVEAYKEAMIGHAQKFYKKAFEKDLAEEKAGIKSTARYEASDSLAAASAMPPLTQSRIKRSKSKVSSPEAKVTATLKSDLKATWQPIKARLLASSKDISNSEATFSMANLISESILTPYMKVHEKYNSSNLPLFRSLRTNLAKSYDTYKRKV